MKGMAKNVSEALDTGDASLGIKDIASTSTDQISVSDNGNLQFVTLSPGTHYTVVISATGSNCNYHYSYENDQVANGTISRDMVVPETGQSVVHTLTCKSPRGTRHMLKMLIVKIASSKTGVPVAATAMK